ncbi:hypothetical protein H257_10032 [Aphanomyces astaci]|uniref:Secreted protein n=1 Tax=Aphanomyces astaci TaxID=112090 RepID=W4G9C2_APHAT|nr:hypothetical protein H257_10032 [Aphanomyces astaci]ETV75634.1 hypothetical protein H257_10032 [Aphanomyces astaci]|eukprot:XP_009834765.1 hypothetical protein H257_10032 [Aphanomyces astaci]
MFRIDVVGVWAFWGVVNASLRGQSSCGLRGVSFAVPLSVCGFSSFVEGTFEPVRSLHMMHILTATFSRCLGVGCNPLQLVVDVLSSGVVGSLGRLVVAMFLRENRLGSLGHVAALLKRVGG